MYPVTCDLINDQLALVTVASQSDYNHLLNLGKIVYISQIELHPLLRRKHSFPLANSLPVLSTYRFFGG